MNLPFRRGSSDDLGSEFDARPIVAVRRNDRSGWWLAGGALIAAVLLFATLEARRLGIEKGAMQGRGNELAAPQAVPDLVVPAIPADSIAPPAGAWLQPEDARKQRTSPPLASPARAPMSRTSYTSPVYEAPYVPPPPAAMQAEGVQPPPQPAYNQPQSSQPGAPAAESIIQASRLSNPSTTVIQGTLINAVLETAIDSTNPGQTRAVVTRDVYGFDGTRILVPRGTRLYGIYESDVVQGQKRAQIRWSRLLTPEGVSVAVDSPATDRLGRAGIQARVNTHFIQRLGNALMSTASTVGSALVTRNIGNSPMVVAVPSAAQVTQPTPNSTQVTPTLTVRQGTRIGVFVQHDIDFSPTDQAPSNQ
jgi:type IV secretion system protein VirB10